MSAASHLRVALVLLMALAPAGAQAWGVSGKHLQGVKTLVCDLESAPQEFRLALNARDRTLQLEGSETPVPYREVSETALDFRFAPPGGPALDCTLELPAGALACRGAGGDSQIGFCLLAR